MVGRAREYAFLTSSQVILVHRPHFKEHSSGLAVCTAPPAWLVRLTVHTAVPSCLWAQKVENPKCPSGSSPSIMASQPDYGFVLAQTCCGSWPSPSSQQTHPLGAPKERVPLRTLEE